MVHREKFCVVYHSILCGTRDSWCTSDKEWNDMLMLPVNSVWLRKTLSAARTEQLQRRIRVGNRQIPLSRALLDRIICSLGDADLDNLRRKHALETLGMLLFCLLDRTCIDFRQQVMVLLCPLDESDVFFSRLFGVLIQATQLEPPVDGGKESKFIEYIQKLALYVFVVLATGCENLERNSILDHFVVKKMTFTSLIDSICEKERSLFQKELAFTLLALLCNHRKRECRNPFNVHLRSLGENSVHMYMFSLREVVNHNVHMLVKCTQGTYSDLSGDGMSDWVETASDSVISWGARLGSAFGAWMIGEDSTNHSQVSVKRNSDTSTTPSRAPLLAQDSFCDQGLWLRTRFILLTLYEILCMSGGDKWIHVMVEHDVPPWAADGNRSKMAQPLQCPDLVLSILKLLSFCLNSNVDPGLHSTQLSLIILRCLVENVKAGTLLFAFCFESTQNIDELEVAERTKSKSNGDLAFLPAVRSKTQANKTVESAHSRRRYESASMTTVKRSLASIVLSMLSASLLQHTQKPEMLTQNGPGTSNGECTNQPNGNTKLIEKHTLAKRGAVCIRIIEVFHRMLIFEKRTMSVDTAGMLGMDWHLAWKSLFSLLDCLSRGLTGFPDLTPARFIGLCAHGIHVINLFLSGDLLSDVETVLFMYQVLCNRSTIDNLASILEADECLSQQNGARRIVQQDLANLRTIIFHFTAVVMILESKSDPSAKDNGEHSESARQKHIISKIAEGSGNLKLKPHNRLRDGFQRFVETVEETHFFRDYIGNLVNDSKHLHFLDRMIRKKL